MRKIAAILVVIIAIPVLAGAAPSPNQRSVMRTLLHRAERPMDNCIFQFTILQGIFNNYVAGKSTGAEVLAWVPLLWDTCLAAKEAVIGEGHETVDQGVPTILAGNTSLRQLMNDWYIIAVDFLGQPQSMRVAVETGSVYLLRYLPGVLTREQHWINQARYLDQKIRRAWQL